MNSNSVFTVPVHNAYQKMKQTIMETTGIGILEDGTVILRYSTKEMPQILSASRLLQNCFDSSVLKELLSAHLSENEAEIVCHDILDIIYSNRNLEPIQKVIDSVEDDLYDVEVELDKLHEYIDQIKDPMEKDIMIECWMNIDIDTLKFHVRNTLIGSQHVS